MVALLFGTMALETATEKKAERDERIFMRELNLETNGVEAKGEE